MPGYDPVRDAGGSDRSSPPPNYHPHHASLPSPSPSSSAYAHRAAAYNDDPTAPQRSLSGHSLDRYGDANAGYGRHGSMHEGMSGSAIISPRSSTSALPPHTREHYARYGDYESAAHRYDHSPRHSMHSDSGLQPPTRRSASIADLIAVSEMSDAEHDRHREAHREMSHYREDSGADRSMSRSSSASGGLHGGGSAAHPHSHPRASHPVAHHHQFGRAERSPSMAHLLNDGTAGAIQDRPRSNSHSSVSSHVSHRPPQHHPSQMSPLGPPSAYAGPAPHTHARDRSPVSRFVGAGAPGSYRVSSPTSIYPPGMHPQTPSTLNRGGSSPGLGPAQGGHLVDRARYAAQAGPVGHGPLPRSGSNSFAHTNASSSPATHSHAHLQPSPSHRFAVPDVPFARSPESRRVPLPHSPISVHSIHPRASLSNGPPPSWNHDEYDAASTSAAGMPPPQTSASPRRGSIVNSIYQGHRYGPAASGNGIPPTPGSVTSQGGYPVTPGSRSLPPTTPSSAHPRHPGDEYEESNYFPRMDEHKSAAYQQERERSSSLTSPHFGQVERANHGGAEYDRDGEQHRAYAYARNSVSTPGSAHHTGGPQILHAEAPPALPRAAMSPSFGPQRRNQDPVEENGSLGSNGLGHRAQDRHSVEAERTRRHAERDSPAIKSQEDQAQSRSFYDPARRDSRSSASHEVSAAAPRSPSARPDDDIAAATNHHDATALPQAQKRSRDPSVVSNRSDPGAASADAAPAAKTEQPSQPEEEDSKRVESGPVDGIAPLPRYAPTRRVSQPRQVIRPIGIDEIDRKRAQCRNPLRREWEQLHQTDSREALDEILRDFHTKLASQSSAKANSNGTKTAAADAKKRVIGDTLEDAEEVADHYNKRREVGIHGREESPIIALRKFNNWIKSVLVGTFARGRDPTLDGRTRARGGRILDLGCGKGGDLKKWEKVRPSGLVGADIAAVSIEQAIARHRDNNNGYPGDFFAFDCFSMSLTEVIPRELLEPMFDNVTLQFCMHYAWESVDKARVMLDNVARYLRKGGVFIGTIPDSYELRERIASSAHPEDRSIGNRYYKVVFDQVERWPAFGNRYTFFLEDAVENVPEYVVDFEVFEELAQEVGLRCIYRKNFAEIYHEGSRHGEYGKLLERMKVVDKYGSLSLDEEMWQAATLYLGFAFEKM
ncbi:related to RNA (guanine-N7-) methyltransferase [Sporisorium reilianum SRZ2]|uniref:mRNA cap guanine-N(7) methyltransferase n=1 Tax=Sporisorium reilianum (strain SRZ2) TaxID=999809 RepID=E7A044_SPORE|nr:related to RNA (guanine-N7-) methyltransferase [Sporisorium reilianum SRZ2]